MKNPNFRKLSYFVAGVVVGGVLTYILDPNHGLRRQIAALERGKKWRRFMQNFSSRAYKDLSHRARGAIAQALAFEELELEDQKLARQVREEIEKKSRNAEAITVHVKDGVVTLSGIILSNEFESVMERVMALPMVVDVLDQLEVYQTEDEISALQGDHGRYLQ